MVWRPIHPVVVLLQPVLNRETGQLGIVLGRRGINPHIGVWALPGGFLEFGETAETAAGREIVEEMHISPDGSPNYMHSYSDDEGHFLLFFTDKMKELTEVEAAFRPTDECLEMKIAYEPEPLAFQSHTEALEAFFKRNGLQVNQAYLEAL